MASKSRRLVGLWEVCVCDFYCDLWWDCCISDSGVVMTALTDELEALKRDERHRTVAETRYWCEQYRLFAERAVAAMACERDAQEPVAWLHIQGNYEEASMRQLDEYEISRGWEQVPLYKEPPAAPVPEDVAKDAERYRWLKSRMVGANFDWDGDGMVTLAFEMPDGCAFCADCDQNIDAAMLAASKQEGRE